MPYLIRKVLGVNLKEKLLVGISKDVIDAELHCLPETVNVIAKLYLLLSFLWITTAIYRQRSAAWETATYSYSLAQWLLCREHTSNNDDDYNKGRQILVGGQPLASKVLSYHDLSTE